MDTLLIEIVKLIVAGVAGGGLMGGIVALRKQRAEEPLTAAQVAESTSATIGEGYKALLAEQRASAAQLEARIASLETQLNKQATRIDDLEVTLDDRNHRLAIWEMWHRHNLTPNWARLRQDDNPPPPPYPDPDAL